MFLISARREAQPNSQFRGGIELSLRLLSTIASALAVDQGCFFCCFQVEICYVTWKENELTWPTLATSLAVERGARKGRHVRARGFAGWNGGIRY